MRYRPHKGNLDTSLALTRTFDGRAELIAILREEMSGWQVDISDDKITVQPYATHDFVSGWKDVHIVVLDGYGVMGFCEGPAK